MNPTKLKSRLLSAAKDLRDEAQLWQGQRRSDLVANSLQLAYTVRAGIPRRDPDQAEAILAAGLNVLVVAMTQRAERILDAYTKGDSVA